MKLLSATLFLLLASLTCLPANAQPFVADPLADRVPAAVHDDAFSPEGKHVRFESDSEWSPADKWAAAAFIVANALDAASTVRALDRGGVELNPLLGKNPSTAKVIGFKAVIVGGVLAYHRKHKSSATRKGLWVSSALLVGIAIHNEGVE